MQTIDPIRRMPFFLILSALLLAAALAGRWLWESWRHNRRITQVRYRIHVNGIRGKSTVTRIVAGILREAGLTTLAKTTGTAAAVISRVGYDIPIERLGPPTILEQLAVVEEHSGRDLDALVIECMAVNPTYQRISEERMVHSTIGILTNVREDHQDVMGERLQDIARSLMSTCPRRGILITAEDNPDIVPIIAAEASRRNTMVIWADPGTVNEADLSRFEYVAFRENVAIGYALADLLWIDRAAALRGMVSAPPDPGVLRVSRMTIGGKHVTWANLFAVNDRESMIAAMQRLESWRTPGTTVVGILNNRSDRARRALQFADVAVYDLEFDRLATFGAYEEAVTQRLKANGYPPDHILNLGERRNPSRDEIVTELIGEAATDNVLVVGFVNIHTQQAELLMEIFEEAERQAVSPSAAAQRAAATLRQTAKAPEAAPAEEAELQDRVA